jgi:hypothetical protein
MDRAVHWSYWLIESERLKLFPISFHWGRRVIERSLS